ncbi:MAG: DUF4199 domain-containing protein [Candidatus Levybacteria bacterium]|nr:DUF4199 domain-containing protein [Candidatus Levybacteria bacterium]
MSIAKENYFYWAMVLNVITVLALALMEFSGNNQAYDPQSSLFIAYQFIIPVIVWYLGIRAKKKQLKNKLTFKQGMIEGTLIGLVFGLTSPFIFLIYYTLINPGIVDSIRHGADPTWLVIGKDMMLSLVVCFVTGLILSPPIAFLLRSKKKK